MGRKFKKYVLEKEETPHIYTGKNSYNYEFNDMNASTVSFLKDESEMKNKDDRNNPFDGQVIAVTSAKGGVGKTTVVTNLGVSLAICGKRVCVIDANFGFGNLDIFLGLVNRVVFDLSDVINGRCRINQSMIKWGYLENLVFIPASQTDTLAGVSEERFEFTIDQLRKSFDYILIDTPSFSEVGFEIIMKGADKHIIVMIPSIGCLRSTDKLSTYLERAEKNYWPMILINRYNADLAQNADMINIKDITNLFSEELLGVVGEDVKLGVAENTGKPITLVNSSSNNDVAFNNIAKRVLGEIIPIQDLFKGSVPKRSIKNFFKM
ncbi:septum site-determining protein MinD [Bacillus anthracis]|nr:septum site-determining protein MinD [Bacillus anthracis]